MLLLLLALAQDDFAFAEGLVERGYMDLADEIYARTPDARAPRLGIAAIRLRQGRAAEACEAYRPLADDPDVRADPFRRP